MTQKRIIAEEKGSSKKPARWSKFKDAVSDTFTRNADKIIRKSMNRDDPNFGLIIDFIGKAGPEVRKEAVEWMKENGKYHNGMIKTLYNNALKEDGIWTGLFVDAYQKADESTKSRFWSRMSDDLNTLLARVEFCDIISEELKYAAMLYVEVGKVDEKADHTKCWDSLVELFEGRGGNSLEVRKFALDILYSSDYGIIDFWRGILTSKENGNYGELRKHAIKLLLRDDVIGGEALIIDNIDTVAGQLNSLMHDELSGHEAERIITLIFERLKKSGSLKEYTDIYLNVVLTTATSENEKVRENFSTGMKRLVERKDEFAEKIAESLLRNSEEMIGANTVGAMANAMRLLETLEFTGKTEEIKNVISKRIKINIREKIEKMFESPGIEDNLRAGNILLALSSSEEAKKLIRKVAIPELKDIAEDEDSSDADRLHAVKMVEKLEKVV